MSLIVNLLGGPCAGKSTLAASLFAELKNQGICSELIAEYAKEWAWDGKKVKTIDEMIIYGRQLERERRFYERKNMIAITDRPMEMSLVYTKMYCGSGDRAETMKKIIELDRHTANVMGAEFINVFVKREKEYSNEGRYENEDEAKVVDELVKLSVNIDLYYDNSKGVKWLAENVITKSRT